MNKDDTNSNQNVQSSQITLNNGFLNSWRSFISLLGPSALSNARFAILLGIGVFILEIIAGLFGYCITFDQAEQCYGGETFIIPIAFAAITFLLNSFSMLYRFLILLSQNKNLRDQLGLTRGNQNYFLQSGLHTFYLPKIVFISLVGSLLSLVLGWGDLVILISLLIILSDLRVLRWMFITKLRLNQKVIVNGEIVDKPTVQDAKKSIFNFVVPSKVLILLLIPIIILVLIYAYIALF